MTIDLTKQNIATTLFITLSLFVMFYFAAPTDITTLEGSIQLPLARELDNFFGLWSKLARAICSGVVILLCCWKATSMVARYTVINSRSYAPITIFAIYSSYMLDLSTITPLISTFFLLCFIVSLFGALKDSEDTGLVLVSYFYLGLSLLFCSAMTPYAALWPVGVILIRGSWRYWVSSLVGMLAPLAIYIYISHMFLGMPAAAIVSQHEGLFTNPAAEISATVAALDFADYATISKLVFAATTVVLIVVSMITGNRASDSMRTRQHKAFILTSYLLVLGIVTILFCNNEALGLNPLAIAMSIILPTYFNYRRGRTTNILYVLLLFSLVVATVYPSLRV